VDPLLDATHLAERTHFWFRGLHRFSDPLIQQALAHRSHPEVLDCGFGTGANMSRLARGGRVYGFDLSLGGVGYARQSGHTRLAHASVLAIPFQDARFDLVTAFDLIACLHEPEQAVALAEMHRVLKPGGALLLNTAALPVLRGSHSVFGQEVHRATREPLRARLVSAGFRVERLTYTNLSILPLMLAVRAAQRLFGPASPHGSPDMVVPPTPVNAALSGLLALEAAALRVVDMPIGASLLALAYKGG
jgi:ubiquinone/menaquinone biosynthesis C-methylase UbiE